ncbi:glycoside hydrolase family 35 protein [Mycena belliarum]|uniref:beta-galactosidase n=1 Tax=Mycena belliarum TaxID=1033014 RepID=A0AAD6U8D3_9AGAR|nr:glycoside hydrolase family 35 protein [Mycena belliae]
MSGQKWATPRRSAQVRTPRLWVIGCILAACLLVQMTPKVSLLPWTPSNAFERTDDVRFDNYSLILKGQRVFLHSGEFHTWRLPVPSLWPDILEKAKAAGLNAISIYTHMGLHNPARGVVDFDGFRALKPLYEAAMAAGLWVVVRPGPYINAETSAGGIAHWVTAEVAGRLRTNDSDWSAAWQAYIDGIVRETAPYQLSRGGPVIAVQLDNEYTQATPGHGEYYEELKAAFRAGGIVVPLTYNDPNQGANFINGTGAVDLYGMDSYPQRFDCSHPDVWRPVVANYHEYHARVNPAQPWYIPEFQAGSFDAWGPAAPGYAPCAELTGPGFQSVFNLQLWASNAKLINYYMLYGGTSWGGLPFPGVYTSYDYGAPITESRALTSKYDELKLQGLFLRSSPDFAKTDWVAESRTGLSACANDAVFVTLLRNPDTRAGFYIVRQNDSTSTATVDFTLSVDTAQSGTLVLPLAGRAITLGGRESKVVVVDYTFGRSRLAYSTAAVLFAGVIGTRDVLFLYGRADQTHEAALHLTGTPSPWARAGAAHAQIAYSARAGVGTVVTFLTGAAHGGLVAVHDSDTQLVLFADARTAGTFWAPALAGAPRDAFRAFWGLGTARAVLVGGPYLVRGATLEHGGARLALTGDLREEVRMTVVAPPGVRQITWNGVDLGGPELRAAAGGGVFEFDMAPRAALGGVRVPALEGWRYRDSLPEVAGDFDDEPWVLADRRETNVPEKMWYGDGRVLYGCDYGFCENIVLWRGHFNATGAEKSVNLSINGGEAFAASVWLNGVFLDTSYGNSTNNMNIIEETDDKFTFPNGALKSGDNVITIVQDNMGLNETEGDDADSSKNPRGVRGFALEGGNFSDWKVQGKLGGYTAFPDKTRGIFNEGGLFGERRGWHLPGFNTSGWEARPLSAGLPSGGAGVGFFVTKFDLDIEEYLDVHMSFEFEDPLGAAYRALLFVNGWMMGKRVANLGPQAKFPVHQGILDYKGENTVAVALWSMEEQPISPRLRLVVDGVFDSTLGQVRTDNPAWSGEGREV